MTRPERVWVVWAGRVAALTIAAGVLAYVVISAQRQANEHEVSRPLPPRPSPAVSTPPTPPPALAPAEPAIDPLYLPGSKSGFGGLGLRGHGPSEDAGVRPRYLPSSKAGSIELPPELTPEGPAR